MQMAWAVAPRRHHCECQRQALIRQPDLQLVTARHSWNFVDNICYRPDSAPSHFHLFGFLTKQRLASELSKDADVKQTVT